MKLAGGSTASASDRNITSSIHEGTRHPNTPVRRAPTYRAPLLGLFGGADPGIPPEQIEQFRAGLREAGVEFDLVVYEGAPHSFFDRSFEEHREAADDAWRRVLGFMRATP